MSLIQLAYASAAEKPFTEMQLYELLLKARKNNSNVGVTGLLLYHRGSFFQVLEGEEAPVVDLFERIAMDERHKEVLLLARKEITARNFGEWSMGFVDVEKLAEGTSGFRSLMVAKSSFLDLQGNSTAIAGLIDGFHAGRWRQIVQG